jgi:ABC-type Fe3+ transport system permease subunit
LENLLDVNSAWHIKVLSGGSMNAPRFSLKQLLVSLTLIVVAVSIAYYVYRADWVLGTNIDGRLELLLWLCSGAMIGAGVLCPFRKTILGAWLGLAVQALLALLVHFLLALAGGSGGG